MHHFLYYSYQIAEPHEKIQNISRVKDIVIGYQIKLSIKST